MKQKMVLDQKKHTIVDFFCPKGQVGLPLPPLPSLPPPSPPSIDLSEDFEFNPHTSLDDNEINFPGCTVIQNRLSPSLSNSDITSPPPTQSLSPNIGHTPPHPFVPAPKCEDAAVAVEWLESMV